MYLCYIDESGISAIPGNTSHFCLVGISLPVWQWKAADDQITGILAKYKLDDAELHTAWLLRRYLEQSKVPDFEKLDRDSRRAAVTKLRTADLLRLQRGKNPRAYRQAKKNYSHSNAYIHLTHAERVAVATEVANAVSGWDFARLFAECIDKTHFDSTKTGRTVDEQAFEQVVSRFQQYLAKTPDIDGHPILGLLVHDNNLTVAQKHTKMMREFHLKGTLWTKVDRIIETPLFVDSSLTRLVQIADLCAYALRRFVENAEDDLFKRIFARADLIGKKAVSVRHFAGLKCKCAICEAHHRA